MSNVRNQRVYNVKDDGREEVVNVSFFLFLGLLVGCNVRSESQRGEGYMSYLRIALATSVVS